MFLKAQPDNAQFVVERKREEIVREFFKLQSLEPFAGCWGKFFGILETMMLRFAVIVCLTADFRPCHLRIGDHLIEKILMLKIRSVRIESKGALFIEAIEEKNRAACAAAFVGEDDFLFGKNASRLFDLLFLFHQREP
ncbi:hypothetical protein QCO44_11600 [Selenomonas sputigena]|uniref:Uncharacterized protein n=1 Tax=Selenomonas sputigena TaxID=69823 RepID=A0ABV3X8V6_9FIRM